MIIVVAILMVKNNNKDNYIVNRVTKINDSNTSNTNDNTHIHNIHDQLNKCNDNYTDNDDVDCFPQ